MLESITNPTDKGYVKIKNPEIHSWVFVSSLIMQQSTFYPKNVIELKTLKEY